MSKRAERRCCRCSGPVGPKCQYCPTCKDARRAEERRTAMLKAREYRSDPKVRERQRRAAEEYRGRYPDRVRATNRSGGREGYLRKRYGMSEAEFNRRAAAQGGGCAICGRQGELHVDHDHGTSAVRGLLCGQCNRALGLLADDPARLAAAIAYLNATPDASTVQLRLIDAAAGG